jgi:hypothetical protein
MAKFRKKPIEIEAIQFDGTPDSYHKILDLSGGIYRSFDGKYLVIETLEGTMKAIKGDWIIKGVKGECYPCKPDIFEATYDLVEEETNSNPNDLRYN